MVHHRSIPGVYLSFRYFQRAASWGTGKNLPVLLVLPLVCGERERGAHLEDPPPWLLLLRPSRRSHDRVAWQPDELSHMPHDTLDNTGHLPLSGPGRTLCLGVDNQNALPSLAVVVLVLFASSFPFYCSFLLLFLFSFSSLRPPLHYFLDSFRLLPLLLKWVLVERQESTKVVDTSRGSTDVMELVSPVWRSLSEDERKSHLDTVPYGQKSFSFVTPRVPLHPLLLLLLLADHEDSLTDAMTDSWSVSWVSFSVLLVFLLPVE